MATHVALARAVNLGPHGKVSMAALRGLVAGMGLLDVQTLLNSGNVMFSTDRGKPAELEALLQLEAAKHLQLHTDFLVRTAAEMEAIVAANPFPAEAKSDPGHLLVMFLKSAPEPAAVAALQAAIHGPEQVRAHERQLYITYPAGVGTSKLTNAVIEAKLATRGTARNWNTVLKLRELLGG